MLYHPLVRATLPIDTSCLRPGLRLAVGLSGGADSVALLRALAERSSELGIVLHAAHLHHGLRGEEADADLAFARALTEQFNVPFHQAEVDTAVEAKPNAATGKSAESIEEAARRLRYAWFRRLMSSGQVDSVATAHTLDDQAETVLAKFLRGAWTEGLSGIHPRLEFPEGHIVRPFLSTTRAEIETWLHSRGQTWREDSSNRHLTFTRNRIRHELLPLLETWNPRLREHMAQMAELARAEQAWWSAEIARLSLQLILPGKPVRGGGRAASEGLALDVIRLSEIHPALQRRLLRHAAEQLGAAPDFAATEALGDLARSGRAGQKLELAQGLRAERTHRELRLTSGPKPVSKTNAARNEPFESVVAVPGELDVPGFGLRLKIEVAESSIGGHLPKTARLRPWKPGDRVLVRHAGSPRKVKEVLERMKVTGSDRELWPVLEFDGRIIWMKGIELNPEPGIRVVAIPLNPEDIEPTGSDTVARTSP